MKQIFTLLIAIIICCVGSGCMLKGPSTSNVSEWQNRVSGWLPVGTPKEDAYRIMKQQGFEWDSSGDNPTIIADKRTGSLEINVVMEFTNGKLISQYTTVSRPVSF